MRSSFHLLTHQAKNNATKQKIKSSILTKEYLDLQSLIKFQELKILSKLSAGKFPVYLVKVRSTNTKVIMKVFPFNNCDPSSHFKNEMNAATLSHPNIISVLTYQEQENMEIKGQSYKLSYILMEFAPYGNMLTLIRTPGVYWDEKLLRTYFHQLIEGIEYLHSQGIAHLDLKLGNLLLGEGFILKVADFDVSQNIKDKKVLNTEGTKNCRAPEIISKECQDLEAVDIYSSGIILFLMKSQGILPFLEDETFQGENLYELLQSGSEKFWKKHLEIQNKEDSFFDQDFRLLIVSMTRRDPRERAKLADVKGSKWYQGPIYSNSELKTLMLEFIRLFNKNQI